MAKDYYHYKPCIQATLVDASKALPICWVPLPTYRVDPGQEIIFTDPEKPNTQQTCVVVRSGYNTDDKYVFVIVTGVKPLGSQDISNAAGPPPQQYS